MLKITYVTHVTFVLGSTDLDDSRENVLVFITDSTTQNLLIHWPVVPIVVATSTF